MTVTISNVTFAHDTTAILDVGAADGATGLLRVYNSLFVSNGVAASFANVAATGHDAFFGNTTNFAGLAVAGPGDLRVDPMLDGSTAPPGLLAGSPCRGAGDPAHAFGHDFTGRARGAAIDIGAVQSSP